MDGKATVLPSSSRRWRTGLSAAAAITVRIGSPAQRAITRYPMPSNSDWKLWFVNIRSNTLRAIIALVSFTVGPILRASGTPLTSVR